MATKTLSRTLAELRWQVIALMGAWLLLIAASLTWDVRQNDSRAVELANTEAKAHLQKDLAFRKWATRQGGLYVRVSPETPPSPHMAQVPERDVMTPSGVQLTLYNPALMLRLLMETQAELYGVKARITGMKYLNPANAPDAWETKALGIVARTGVDYAELVTTDGKQAMRRMQPMWMEEGCLKCHAWTGIKVGELRGATDVAIPLEPYMALQNAANFEQFVTHGIVFLLGISFIGFIGLRRHSNLKESFAHQAKLGQLELAVDQSASAILIMTRDGIIQYVNQRVVELSGYAANELVGNNLRALRTATIDAAMWDALGAGRNWRGEFETRRKTGELQWWTESVSPVKDAQGGITFVAVFEDITQRKQAEAERVKLEARLQQAQRMESVGQLAGGVAHDFNNMLAVILGNTEEALRQVEPGQPIHEDLEEIRGAAVRSADLTRQLLAFARRQPVAPRVLDLNHTVQAMLAMLRRLIGEGIQLTWQPVASLWPVHLDPSQMDQILTNLCVNARDAIAGVGAISLTADHQVVDAAFCANRLDAVPGEYVRLSVSDTGVGMDSQVQAQIFEPFFTTKGVGKGTGLGLATVYGSVRQNRGFITVRSAQGQGTTFEIYLPRYVGEVAPVAGAAGVAPSRGGGETILVVEDQPSILRLTTRSLEAKGYTVLGVNNPAEAVQKVKEHAGPVALLLTDVVMPGMNGSDLADTLVALRPRLKVLFMSGYASSVLPENHTRHFIGKPFTLEELALKVREVMDRA